jgi:hypothetical protein
MSFTMRMKFTGICTFVKNLDGTYYAVLANGDMGTDFPLATGATSGKGFDTGADGQLLRRHRGFVRIRLSDVLGPNLADNTTGILWYFKKRLDEGRTANEAGHDLKADFFQNPSAPLTAALDNLAKLTDYAPDYSTLDSNIFGSAIPDTVVARVLIDRGTLSSTGNYPQDWSVLNTLNPNMKLDDPRLNPKLTNEVTWEVGGLSQLRLSMDPFQTGTRYFVDIKAADGAIVEVTVANLCEDNPLQWGPSKTSARDVDFRWHYQLIDPDQLARLKALLNDRDLPYPIPHPINGLGIDCLPALASR